MGIIDDTLTSTIEVPNQMNVGSGGAWTVEPGLSKSNRFVDFCLFVLNKKNLTTVSKEKIEEISDMLMAVHLLGPQLPSVSLVLAFSNSHD